MLLNALQGKEKKQYISYIAESGILLCGVFIQLSYGTPVVLLRLLLFSELMHLRSPYVLKSDSAMLKPTYQL
jgi:hypothetical protein